MAAAAEPRPAVFRGPSWRLAWRSLSALALTYAGGYAVLWALGLVVRGWRGWALLIGPLVILAASRLWTWRRVSVAIEGPTLRYEGTDPVRDFELSLSEIEAAYFDRTLEGEPLALVLADRDERVLSGLDERAARRLYAHLLERGVSPVRAEG